MKRGIKICFFDREITIECLVEVAESLSIVLFLNTNFFLALLALLYVHSFFLLFF